MSKTIAIINTGSRAFKTNFENSDLDQIEVFIVPWEDLYGYRNNHKVVKEVRRYELAEFMENIVKGDFMCHQALWSPHEEFKLRTDAFAEIIANRRTFITKSILQNWLYLSEFFFNKSVEIGKLHLDIRTIHDFLDFASDVYGPRAFRPLNKVLEDQKFDPGGQRHSMDTSRMAIFQSKFGKNFYDLYELYAGYNKDKYQGMFTDKGKLNVEPDEKRSNTFLVYKGVLRYNEEAHQEYIQTKNLIANAKVAQGYAEKSMYHAFRILTSVGHYIRYAILPVNVPNPTFLMDIRRSNYNVKNLIQRYEQEKSNAYQIFDLYEDEVKPNIHNLAKNIVKKLRDNLVSKEVTFHSPAI